jgi:hypothetical protein
MFSLRTIAVSFVAALSASSANAQQNFVLTTPSAVVNSICLSTATADVFVDVGFKSPDHDKCPVQEDAGDDCPGMWMHVDTPDVGAAEAHDLLRAAFVSKQQVMLKIYEAPNKKVNKYCKVGFVTLGGPTTPAGK